MMAISTSLAVAAFKFLSEQNQSVSFTRGEKPLKRLTLDGPKYTTLTGGLSIAFFGLFLAVLPVKLGRIYLFVRPLRNIEL